MKKLLILLLLATQSLSFGQQIFKKKQSLLGSPFEITVVAKDSVQGNLFSDLAIAEVKRIENLISDWIPTSQISKVNQNAGISPVKVDKEVFDLVERATKISKLTSGAFDISYASMDRIWKFDGSMKEMPTPEEIRKSVEKVGYQNIILNSKDTTIFLKNKGITKIDYLVGTHPHEDHIGGLDDVIDNFDIGTIYMPKMQTTTKTFEDVLDSIAAKNVQVTTPVVGDKFTLTNADCTIMATDTKDTEENLNLSSIVIRMTYGGNSFLFMGDAEAEVEEARNWQPADVLKVGHHGSKTSSTQNFIMQVMPSIAIIQVGKDNSYNLPNQETIDKLNAVGTKIYRTDESGNILVTSDGSNIQVETNVK